MRKVDLSMVLLGCSLALINSLDICEDEEDGARLAHPADCSKFIECANGVTVAIRYCPHGLHFNRFESICDYKFRAGCDYSYALQLLNGNGASELDCSACKAKCDYYEQPHQIPIAEKPKPRPSEFLPGGTSSSVSSNSPTSEPKPDVTLCITTPSTTVNGTTKPVEPSTPAASKPEKPTTIACTTPTASTIKPSSSSAKPNTSTWPASEPTTTICSTKLSSIPNTTPSTPVNTTGKPEEFTTHCASKTPKPTTTPYAIPTAPTPKPTLPSSKPTTTSSVTNTASKSATTPCNTKPSSQPTTSAWVSKTLKPSKTYNGRGGAPKQLLQKTADKPTSIRLCEYQGLCADQKDGTLFADPLTKGFIVCHNQCEVKVACPTGLVYNHKLKVCDWPTF